MAQKCLEESSSHYQARVAKKQKRQNRHQYYINRKAMKNLLEQIEATYADFKKDAELQSEKGVKIAGLRARKNALQLEKIMKEFRRVSLGLSKSI